MDNEEIICEVCSRPYILKSAKGHSKTRCNSCVVNVRKYTIMKRCFEYKGGKCQICGYDKCTRSLNFHHRDPSKKTFIISGNFCRKWEIIQMELDKCDLLCANCHGEIHHEEDKFKMVHWEPRKRAKFYDKVCPACNKDFQDDRKARVYCSDDCKIKMRSVRDKPSKEQLIELLKTNNTAEIARMYKVSWNCVGKWKKSYKINKDLI